MAKASITSQKIDKLKNIIDSIEEGNESLYNDLYQVMNDLSNKVAIVRTIELPLIWQQAGLGLLNFTSRVLTHCHPDVDVVVKVEQHKEVVRLVIDVAEQHRDAIEDTVEKYGMALRRKLPLNELFSAKEPIMELKQKLDISALELNITAGLLAEENLADPTDFAQIEEKINALHDAVGEGLSAVHHLQQVITELMERNSGLVGEALKALQAHLDTPLSADDEEGVKKALAHVQEHEPDLFEEIRESINKGSISGKAGDYLYGWLSAITNILPR